MVRHKFSGTSWVGIAVWLAGFFYWPSVAGWLVARAESWVSARDEREGCRKVEKGNYWWVSAAQKVKKGARERERGFSTAWVAHALQLARPLPLSFTTYHLPFFNFAETSLDWCLTLTLQFHRLELSNVNSALQPLPQASQYGKKLYLKTVKKNHLYNIVSSWYSSTALTPRCFGERCFTACLYLTDKICQAFYFPRQWLLKSMQPGLTNTLFLPFSFETQKHSHLVSKCWM